MKIFFRWILYFPLRKLVSRLSSRHIVMIMDMLAAIEYRLHEDGRSGFLNYLTELFANTPLAGREKELMKQCFRFRQRVFALNTLIGAPQVDNKLVNPDEIQPSGNGGGQCFAIAHAGYFYSGYCSIPPVLSGPLYIVSMMKPSASFAATQCNRFKMRMQHGLPVCPVPSVAELKSTVLPAVSADQACYAPTLDAVTASSKLYPFLNGRLVLSLRATCRFVCQTERDVVFFISLDAGFPDRIETRVVQTIHGRKGREADCERQLLETLETMALTWPEHVDWYFWWKNRQRFEKRTMK